LDLLKPATGAVLTLAFAACAATGVQQAVRVSNPVSFMCPTTSEPPTTTSEPTSPVVLDSDRPPRQVKTINPQYSQEAFDKNIEGIVLVEILIDRRGRVVRARVLESIPLLDTAALDAVCQWRFEPAMKDGQPVATIANAPVGFRIFTPPTSSAPRAWPPPA
jgi:TonB family protein